MRSYALAAVTHAALQSDCVELKYVTRRSTNLRREASIGLCGIEIPARERARVCGAQASIGLCGIEIREAVQHRSEPVHASIGLCGIEIRTPP